MENETKNELITGGSAIDHEKRRKIEAAFTINIFHYGNQMIQILDTRQKIASILLTPSISENEFEQRYKSLEYCNEQIKLILGL